MADFLSSKSHQNIMISSFDVLCGRNKMAFNNIGNRRFRIIVSLALNNYVDVKSTRKEKAKIIRNVVESVKACGGRFLNTNGDGNFEELSDLKAYDKVGHAIRDMVLSKNLGDNSWMGKDVIDSQKLSAPKMALRELSKRALTVDNHEDQMIGKTITFYQNENSYAEQVTKKCDTININIEKSEIKMEICYKEPEIIQNDLNEIMNITEMTDHNNIMSLKRQSSSMISNNKFRFLEFSSGSIGSDYTKTTVQGSSIASTSEELNDEYTITPAMFDDDVDTEKLQYDYHHGDMLSDYQSENSVTADIDGFLLDIERKKRCQAWKKCSNYVDTIMKN